MKKAFIYTIRVICAIVGMLAFVMLFGEPTDEVTSLPLFGIKLLCILALWLVYKVCIYTLPEDKIQIMKEFEYSSDLLYYLHREMMKEDTKEETSHILWDWTCDSRRIMNFLCGMEKDTDELIIAFRKSGLEAGTEEEVRERCEILGQPYRVLRITKKICGIARFYVEESESLEW